MEKQKCRGCGKELTGDYTSGVYVKTQNGLQRCPQNHYGGFVCSYECDFKSSLELECSMPGHNSRQTTLGCFSSASLKLNWNS